MEVNVHENTILSMDFCCKIFDMQDFRIKLLFCVHKLSI